MPNFSDRSYARRPYLGLGSSLIDFFTQPVRFLKESNVVESKLEKPYLSPDYRSMHFRIPTVNWPTWRFRPFDTRGRRNPPRPPLPYDRDRDGHIREQRECPCCFFVWWGDCDGDDLNGGQFITVFSDYPYNTYTHGWTISGNYKNFRTYPPYNSGDPRFTANSTAAFADAAYFDFDETQLTGDGFAFVTLCYNIEGVCQHCVDYWAPCVSVGCPPAVPFTFDDASTPNTIAPGGTITMYVLGGSGPFDWSVTGTGYTLGSAQTTARNNTLTSASGTCGTHYAPVAEVTVTDACGTPVDFEIRNTGGHWGAQFMMLARCKVGPNDCQSCFVFVCVPTTQTNCKATGPVTDIVGGARWITNWACICDTVEANARWCLSGVDRDGDPNYCPPSYLTLQSSQTGDPHECDDGGNHGVCIGDTSSHWHWIC